MQNLLEIVQAALRHVPDPEMPISIVDLGIVADVRISHDAPIDSAPTTSAQSAAATAAAVVGAIVDVDMIPTFVGCPALEIIERDVVRALAKLPGVSIVRVHWKFDPPWSPDRISDAGRRQLAEIGISTPTRGACGESGGAAAAQLVPLRLGAGVGAPAEAVSPACPFCGSAGVTLDSPFGPTRCKMIYHCDACQNVFEHIKSL